jgi:hypothetical protein
VDEIDSMRVVLLCFHLRVRVFVCGDEIYSMRVVALCLHLSNTCALCVCVLEGNL